jgi:hypothetical protein
MGQPQYIYAGGSWAGSSFPQDLDATNLSREWNIPCVNVSQPGLSVLSELKEIKQALKTNPLPVIWVYNEPLRDVKQTTGLWMLEFIQRADWRELSKKSNQFCLEKINALGVPVLLIGGGRDITDCEFENITVGHPSWQKWLAEQAGMSVVDGVIDVNISSTGKNYKLTNCWGYESVQAAIHENQNIRPDPELVDTIFDIILFWEELQKRDWFFEVHPNKRGNVEFAKFLKPVVDKFLKENTNG